MSWTVHWLEAEGELGPWCDRIASEIEAARGIFARTLSPPVLDILVQRLAGAGIPELGMVGHAHRRSLFSLTLDPENPNFETSLVGFALRRLVVHEAHHCLRMRGVGYGRTLGEALVSEGLAGQFTRHVCESEPELWERGVDERTLQAHLPSGDALRSSKYDHESWFFGTDGSRPRWLGYTLGYRVVGDWLATNPDLSGSRWVEVSAREVLSSHLNVLRPA